jgi:hypothetical protein
MVLALGAGTWLVPRAGHAEVADAIYSDVRTVIEELITKELSEQVAPGISCLSGRTEVAPDGYSVTYSYTPEGAKTGKAKTVHLEAATHFPKTLQRVFNRQYGTLRTAIRDESAGLAGLLVYQALHQLQLPAPDAAALAKLRKSSLSCPADPEQIAEKDQAARASAPCSEEGAAAAARPAPKPGPDFSAMEPAEFIACKAEVKKGFADGTWGERNEYPLDAACKTESFECDIGQAVRASLSGQSAAAQDALIKATALAVRQLAEQVYSNLALPPNPALMQTVQQQVLFLLRQQLAGDGWELKPLRASLTGVFRAAAKVDLSPLSEASLTQLLEQLASHAAGSLPAADLPALQAKVDALAVGGGAVALDPMARLAALFQKLERVHAAWRSAVDVTTGKLDVGSFVRGLIGQGGALADLCPVESKPGGSIGLVSANDTLACKVIAKVSGSINVRPDLIKAIADVQPILSHASKAEYTEAAQLAIGYVFQLASRNKPDSEIAVYERFAKSVATYVLDAGQHEAPSEAARVAFRSAAVDMIQHLGKGGGLQRNINDNAYNWLLPDLVLRASWSPSYLNRTDSPTRVQASANWLNLRIKARRTAATYIGFEASLADPLAPLSELVLRKTDNVHYHDVNTLWANLLTPRVEVLAASPALSEHLALSAGMSLRLAAPVFNRDKTRQSGDGDHYDYKLVWNANDPDDKSLWLRFLEFGFSVKYVL